MLARQGIIALCGKGVAGRDTRPFKAWQGDWRDRNGHTLRQPKKGLEEITAGLVKDFKVVFSPSELTQSQAVNIAVGGEAMPDSNPIVSIVTDMDTMKHNGTPPPQSA